MLAEHRDVCQLLVIDNGIVYRPNPTVTQTEPGETGKR